MLLLKNPAVIFVFLCCFMHTQALTWRKELKHFEAIFDRDSIEHSNFTLAFCRDSDIKINEKICVINQNILPNEKFSSMTSGHECKVVLQPEKEFSVIRAIKAVSFGPGRVILLWIDEDRWENQHNAYQSYLLKFLIIYTEDCRTVEGEVSFDYTVDKPSSFLKGNTVLTFEDGTFDVYLPNYVSVKKWTFNSNGKLITTSRLDWLSQMDFDCLNIYPLADHSPAKGHVILLGDQYQRVLLYRDDGSVKVLNDLDIQSLSTENNLIVFCTAALNCWQYTLNGDLLTSFKMVLPKTNAELIALYNLEIGGFLAVSTLGRQDFFVSTISDNRLRSEVTWYDPTSCDRNELVSRIHRRIRREGNRVLEEHCIVLVCKTNTPDISFKCFEILRNGSLRSSLG